MGFEVRSTVENITRISQFVFVVEFSKVAMDFKAYIKHFISLFE